MIAVKEDSSQQPLWPRAGGAQVGEGLAPRVCVVGRDAGTEVGASAWHMYVYMCRISTLADHQRIEGRGYGSKEL